MSAPSAARPGKRKQPPKSVSAGRQNKRAKFTDARTIASQTSGKAYGNGELDVEKFVQAREYEIKALEKAVKKSRSALSSRAFQSVPRELRRRTASHNVKKVPKRLQARARKEMREDNTPIVNSRTRRANLSGKGRLRLDIVRSKQRASEKTKAIKAEKRQQRQDSATPGPVPPLKKGELQRPSTPKAKFRKRQRFKAWLPTHLFHAKRAHMPPSKEPLWRMAIPLSPTQKCYRPTHRAINSRGAMAWDKSYMSTIGLVGRETSIVNVLKALGVGHEEGNSWWTTKAGHWLSGTRAWDGWVYERDTDPRQPIAPVTILWQVLERSEATFTASNKKQPRRQLFIRVHPSAFLQLWHQLLRLCKISKPEVTMEDLRFEIGSIELVGPAATEALVGTLWPLTEAGHQINDHASPQTVWQKLRSLSNPGQLPLGGSLGFDTVDPRLHHPPRNVATDLYDRDQLDLVSTLAEWPVDKSQTTQHIFGRRARVLAERILPSQKSINRRKGQAVPGAYPTSLPSDPQIPILAFVQKHTQRGQGLWTVMMPWKCVSPVWYSLMFYPLSNGGTLRFGGLEQTRQIAFEAGTPWFPADYPGTEAGKVWENDEQQKRKVTWESRPEGRRANYDGVDLGKGRKGEVGIGWACDWSYLLAYNRPDAEREGAAWKQSSLKEALQALRSEPTNDEVYIPSLAAVKITMLQQGTSTTCARVYRLPTTDMELRKLWLERSRLTSQRAQADNRQRPKQKPHVDDAAHQRREYLAAMLLGKTNDRANGESNALVVPGEGDLIGFVTTGNFNLLEGVGTSIGSIALNMVTRPPVSTSLSSEDFREGRHLCIVRESGQSLGRLARWELA